MTIGLKKKRKPRSKPDLIIAGDLHLRLDTPVCRMDDYVKSQTEKLKFIKDLSVKYGYIPVVAPGDVFNSWRANAELITYGINTLPYPCFSIAGNHDLPKHNLDLIKKSPWYTLYSAKVLQKPKDYKGIIFKALNYGEEIKDYDCDVMILHTMTWKNKLPYPNCPDGNAKSLLKKLKTPQLIITGDNHEAFVEEYEGRLLVNAGSMMRMTAKQIEFKPRVYLYYFDENILEKVYLPIKKDIITRDHIEAQEEKDERMEAFVNRLDEDWEVGMDFKGNMKKFLDVNKTKKEVKEIVWEVMG